MLSDCYLVSMDAVDRAHVALSTFVQLLQSFTCSKLIAGLRGPPKFCCPR